MNSITLAAKIRESLAAYTDGRLPTVKALAAEYGVSPVTALRAIHKLEADGLLTSIRGRGIFLKGRDRHRPLRIGTASLDYSHFGPGGDVAFLSFFTGAEKAIREAGFELTRIFRDELCLDPARARRVLEPLDALLISKGCLDEVSIPILLAWGKPVVVLQLEAILDLPFHQVLGDLPNGFNQMVDYLVRSRTRELLLVELADNPTQLNRNRIFREALQRHPQGSAIRLETFTNPHAYTGSAWLSGRQVGKLLLERGRLPETIAAWSDFTAFGIADTLSMAGLEAGRDYRLVSYDDLEGDGFTPFGEPLLTSLRNPKTVISECAGDLLLHLERIRPGHTLICRIPCDLVVRRSSKKTNSK